MTMQPTSVCRFRYELSGEALGLGVSGGMTALLLILLAAAAAGGSAGQNTGRQATITKLSTQRYSFDCCTYGNAKAFNSYTPLVQR